MIALGYWCCAMEALADCDSLDSMDCDAASICVVAGRIRNHLSTASQSKNLSADAARRMHAKHAAWPVAATKQERWLVIGGEQRHVDCLRGSRWRLCVGSELAQAAGGGDADGTLMDRSQCRFGPHLRLSLLLRIHLRSHFLGPERHTPASLVHHGVSRIALFARVGRSGKFRRGLR
jgi:hypothetical protein